MSISSHAVHLRKSAAVIEVPSGDVCVIESHHDKGFQMETGVWPFHKICWVAIGRGTLEFPAGSTALRRDDFLLLPAGWSHRFVDSAGSPLTLVIFCISSEYFSANSNRELPRLWKSAILKHAPGRALCARTGFHHTALIDLIRRALHEQSLRPGGWKTALRAATDELLLHLVRGHLVLRTDHKATSRQAVEGAIEHLEIRPYEPLQIADMALRCQLSPRRFTDIFRSITGETFNAYLNRKRIHFAIDRLRKTGHILYACYESGFNDPAYFYRVFKKQTGCTPGEFLKQEKA